MEEKELLFRFSIFERQIRELQQQIESVERGIIDLDSLKLGLDELIDGKGKEIFAPIGRGIFVKAKLVSEELNVDIGDGNFVQKNIQETKEIIEGQIGKLEQVKKELEESLEQLGEEVAKIMKESENFAGQNHSCNCSDSSEEKCSCGNNCKCEK